MQSQMKIKSWMWPLAIVFMVLLSCKDRMEEHYAPPSYLAGSAWEDLTKRGDYTIFLAGVEKVGYKKLVDGRGLVNVMAPNDEAFTTYLQSKGYGSIDEMPMNELTKLITFHLLSEPSNKSDYAHYNPYGNENEFPPNEMGMFYKHQTNARVPISTETYNDPNAEPSEVEVKVFHGQLLLPIFSQYFFDNKQIDAASNYEYFYPNSTWTSDPEGFNVSEAEVSEYEIITDNGFVYLIDKVLEPLETIYSELEGEGEYSGFLNLYDRFLQYEYDDVATEQYGAGEDLYRRVYIDLPNIAAEWPVSDFYASIPQIKGEAYSVFVPDNNTLEQFFQSYWAAYYSSLSEVADLPVMWLLNNHVGGGSVLFPQEIREGRYVTEQGTPIIFDPDQDVSVKKMCTNGAYYGMNKVLVPGVFNSVVGPAFQDPEYRMFLHMVAYADLSSVLSSDAVDYTMFIPSDSAMIASGYYDLPMQYYDPDPTTFGDESIQLLDGTWGDMGTNAMENYVNSHIGIERLSNVNGTDVYKSRIAYSYIYAKGNTVASNIMYNEDSPFAGMRPIPGDWTNGIAYDVDTAILSEQKVFKLMIGSADEVPALENYKEFAHLLESAGLLPLNNPLDFLLDKYMVFVPSNEAILNAPDGTIPTDPAELAAYLKYYFVNVPASQLSDYVFPGAGIQGTFETYQDYNPTDTIPIANVTVIDNGSNLTLTNSIGSQTATVTSELPKVYGDCAVYVIDKLIQPE